MKKIFYILASAIVALGAVACQNEVDENINPNDTKEITFNVSFDESTRIAGTVADGKATFTFDGKGINGNGESVADSLYVGYSNFDGESYDTKRAALTNTDTDPLTFTADQENMNILNELVGVDNVLEFEMKGGDVMMVKYFVKKDSEGHEINSWYYETWMKVKMPASYPKDLVR